MSTFIDRILALSQVEILCNSLFNIVDKEYKSFSAQKMLVSSANNINSAKSDTLLKSLMYNKNNNGPRIDPWGTPHEINLEDELATLNSTN